MLTIDFTRQYLKDLKLARKRNLDEQKLNNLILILIQEEVLPVKYKEHLLHGDYNGFRECHILPDWFVLEHTPIYSVSYPVL